MKVNILDTSPPNQGRPVSTTVEMPQCPAVGEMIFMDDSMGIEVKSVLWCLYEHREYDVQIRAW